ncbi:hypothetical protein PRIPAC_84078, partial [Pristionchus pacificus]|uniref:F-box domain-containing protein n=1 Tax=Pristionchus pacificus TaxID=54126 RepID=A0A2A6BSH9_PRIPA
MSMRETPTQSETETDMDPHEAYLSVKYSMKPATFSAFELQPQLGNEDYLSNLPDDCLRLVFGFLNRIHMKTLSRVSQKLHSLSINLSNVSTGFEFIMEVRRDSDYIWSKYSLQRSLDDPNHQILVPKEIKGLKIERIAVPADQHENLSTLILSLNLQRLIVRNVDNPNVVNAKFMEDFASSNRMGYMPETVSDKLIENLPRFYYLGNLSLRVPTEALSEQVVWKIEGMLHQFAFYFLGWKALCIMLARGVVGEVIVEDVTEAVAWTEVAEAECICALLPASASASSFNLIEPTPRRLHLVTIIHNAITVTVRPTASLKLTKSAMRYWLKIDTVMIPAMINAIDPSADAACCCTRSTGARALIPD